MTLAPGAKPLFGGKLTATADQHRTKWCVYSHVKLGEDNPMFIGHCPLADVYNFTECYRHSWWRLNMTGDVEFSVNILYLCDDARSAERQMSIACTVLKPIGNRLGYLLSGKVSVTCTEGELKGRVWASVTDAARDCGVTPGAISNHLNVRRGYESVRGMKFVRGFVT